MEELEARVAQLETQQAYQTNALLAALEARWAGEADSVDGWVKALDPTMVTDPKTPLY
jgi:uncharacterized coiled-coil protein SlyX